jgi:glycosyltransferase involved in cell wall biosynthesis
MSDNPSGLIVSVIIPTRNEAHFINRCLRSIFSSDFMPAGTEVIIVDGMSEDGTRQILADWERRQPALRVLDNPQRIVPTAMNIGVRAARGQWIIRMDAHSEYPADYLNRCLATSRLTGMDNIGGSVVTMPGSDSAQGRLVQALTTHPFGVGNSGFRVGARAGNADTVPFGCYRRDVFERIGLYDERLVRNQDYELNARLRMAGGSIWHDPGIHVRYYNQGTLNGLLRQALVTGQWNPWMWYVAPYSFAWRHAAPAAFVSGLLGSVLLLLVTPLLGWLTLGAALVPYFAAGVVASFQQSRRYGRWMFACLPILFFVYHIAYGLGEVWGVCLLSVRRAPVQRISEPWRGAGAYRAWPLHANPTADAPLRSPVRRPVR